MRLFIGAAMALAFGMWMAYDAYVLGKYPYPVPYNVNDMSKHVFNHYGPFVFIPLGLVLVIWGIAALRRVLVAEGDGLGYRGQAKRPWAEISSVDASRLAGQGHPRASLHRGQEAGAGFLEADSLQGPGGLRRVPHPTERDHRRVTSP